MNCPKCQTPAAQGATHCRRCGSPLSAKAAAAPAASDEYELMPLEPSKPSSFNPYEAQPGVEAPPPPPAKGAKGAKALPAAPADPAEGPPGPPPPGTYVPKIRGANAAPAKTNLNLIIGGVVLVIIVGFIAWRLLRTKNEVVVGKPKLETLVSLSANQQRVENISVTGVVPYTMDVEVTEGEMIVGVVQRPHKDPANIAALKKLPDPVETLRKGDKKPFSGEFKHQEQWSLIFYNDSKKSARAKVKFQTQAP